MGIAAMRNKCRFILKLTRIVSCATLLQGSVSAQMVDPSIDRDDEPFSYFSRPTDVLGVMDGSEGTLITPEGYLATGFGELMFFTGHPAIPVNQRVKTLLRGHLPVVQYEFVRDGVRYAATMFAATLDGNPESPLLNFVRFRIRNQTNSPRTVFFTAATRYQNDANTDWGIGDNRFNRPALASAPGGYEQAGVAFDPKWEYDFSDDAFLRNGLVMYLFDPAINNDRRIVLKTGYNEAPEFGAMKIPILPTTPVGVTRYRIALVPGEVRSLDFKMPYTPVRESDPFIKAVRAARFDEYLASLTRSWDSIFARGIEVVVPEEKVNNAFKANLVYDLLARNKQGDHYIQKVNEFQYDSFWLRDASYIVRMYDVSGYHDIARQCLEFFPRWQKDDGNFLSQGGQYDGWGQALWAFGQHARITSDTAFARRHFPAVRKAFDWLVKARAGDALRLIPVTTPGDNENITGHVTGHNFWALAGLNNGMKMADLAGERESLAEFRREYADFHAAVLRRLETLTRTTGGYIPPSMDKVEGSDWGNMMAVYPEQILDPHHPMVTATLDTTRARYQEGIMTYDGGRYLHHYLTMKNTETELIRGDQERVIEELYALLVHTSSTHAGFEFSILPWGDRDFGMNLSPHGWFSAKFRTLIRNMMVREEGDDLHVLSCVSPAWMAPGDSIIVRRAATDFGPVGLTMSTTRGRSVLEISGEFRVKPRNVIVHIPWFLEVQEVVADGKPVTFRDRRITLSADVRTVEMKWVRTSEAHASYDSAVRDFKDEYRRRYEQFLIHGGEIR